VSRTRNPWPAVLSIAPLVIPLDVTIVNVALPSAELSGRLGDLSDRAVLDAFSLMTSACEYFFERDYW
jgi:hypothetical protein